MQGAYCYVSTPIGELFVAASQRGIIRLGFEGEESARDRAAADLGAPLVELSDLAPGAEPVELLRRAAVELREYFDGERTVFEVPIDLHLGGFRGQVVRDLANIGYGERFTYGQLAARANNPGAVRAVGSACANNPIPIFLPCHRVVRSDGSWGKYRGGEEAKTYLLNLESRPS